MISIDRLRQRVQAGLTSPEFAEAEYDAIYEAAITETEGIVGNRDLAEAFVMDIAYYRFVILVDAGVQESDETNYKLALSQLKNAAYKTVDEDTGETSTASRVAVRSRRDEYGI